MSQPALCSACAGIFEGRYITFLEYLQDHGTRLDGKVPLLPPPSAKPPDFANWGIKMNGCPGPEQAPALHLHHSLLGLSKSKNSCVLCAIIWEQIHQPAETRTADLGDDHFGVPIIMPESSSIWGPFVLTFMYVKPRQNNTYTVQHFQELRNLEVLDMTVPRNIDTWLSSFHRGRSLSRIKSWLQEETTLVPDMLLPSALPTRLLQIRPLSKTNTTLEVRLTQGFTLDKSTRYAALSHCWGAKHPLKLLKGNVEEFSNGIPLDKIPKTFRDAIELAFSLDIHHLWIDSLCIIQDSKTDWAEQAALMASVYLGACVTISTTAADDSSTGTMPESILSHPCLFTPTWTGFGPLEKLKKPMRLIDNTAYCHQILLRPLSQRGWVYQERNLSRKTIHCARDQLWWSSISDARGYIFNETCNGHKYQILQVQGVSQFASPSDLYSLKGDSSQDQTLSPRSVWGNMVEEYMTRQFTFESDRLIALAGIASVYQRLTEIPEESYLAGLWRHTFLQDLLWVTREGSRVCPPQLYRAPTWSWASMEPRDQTDRFSWGYVEATPSGADINPNHLVATVKAVEVETPGSRFGLVSSAHIVLQSYLIKACLSTEIKNVPSYFTDEQVAEFFTGGRREYAVNTLALFADDDLTTFPPEAMSVEDSLESLMKPVLDDTLLPFSIPKKMAVYLAIIECFLDHAKRGDGHALVLVKGSQKGEYRRIGYVRLKQKVMYPWTTHGHFGAFEALDPSEYLQKGAEAGSYAYRVV